MKQDNKNGTTLDGLATMVARGFANMVTKDEFNNRSNDVDRRFDDVDRRFDKVDVRLDDLERKVDKVDFRVDQVHGILDQGEKDFLNLRKRVQVLEKVTSTP